MNGREWNCKMLRSNWRIAFVILFVSFMIFATGEMASSGTETVHNGKADLSGVSFVQNKAVTLDGHWEFYWDRLVTSADFEAEAPPKMDAFIKVPGSWYDKMDGKRRFPRYGVASYRLSIIYPSAMKEPAIRIQGVSNAYKVYANGKLLAEVGRLSDKPAEFKEGERALIVGLPNDKTQIELIIQVGNFKYSRGGLRNNLEFGSKQAFEHKKTVLLAQQIFFMGSIFIFGIYYFLLFTLQTRNRTALLFSLICLITAVRSFIWGEVPLQVFFPNVSFNVIVYINYLTGCNLIPIMSLFVSSIYPLETKKKALVILLLPTLFFDILVFAPPKFVALFTASLYILIMLHIIYIMVILIRAVFHKRDNGILLFTAICIYILAIISDILNYKGFGSVNVSAMFLYGNFSVIMAMSYVQAKQQVTNYKKLVLYNANLIEAKNLKDKIMATEMSFLQAQIKPHFLYNALNAIANVCEKDGQKAGRLILDLAIYLRKSLEFNTLDKMVTIEKELEFVDTYFHIEQARFGEKIQLIKQIEVSSDFKLPALILQPLVENAVRHGISKKSGGGTVSLRMKQAEAGINLEIEDDGVGIESERVTVILSETGINQGVGLQNIHHRLLRLYGSGLEIKSEVGRGTMVKILIPERSTKL